MNSVTATCCRIASSRLARPSSNSQAMIAEMQSDGIGAPTTHEELGCLSHRAPPIAIDHESKAAFADGVTRSLVRRDDIVGERRGTTSFLVTDRNDAWCAAGSISELRNSRCARDGRRCREARTGCGNCVLTPPVRIARMLWPTPDSCSPPGSGLPWSVGSCRAARCREALAVIV